MRVDVALDLGHLPAVDQLGDEASLALVFAVGGAAPIGFVAVDAGPAEALALVDQKHALVDGGELRAYVEAYNCHQVVRVD